MVYRRLGWQFAWPGWVTASGNSDSGRTTAEFHPYTVRSEVKVDNSTGFPDLRLGVFCCGHVFRRERPVRLVDHGRDWQFLCGGVDHADRKDVHLVHVGELLNFDRILNALGNLPFGWEAERDDPVSPWIRTGPQATDA